MSQTMEASLDDTISPPSSSSQALAIRSQSSSEVQGTIIDSGAVNGIANTSINRSALYESQDEVAPQSLRILSLDGGGVKGYTALLILQRIINTLKEQSGLDDDTVLKPCQIFDLIIGTSTGGLIATMLGRLEMSVEEALQQYEIVGEKIFRGPGLIGKATRALISRPFFDIESLQEAVKTLLKEKNIDIDEQFRIEADPTCKVMLCVTNKQTGKSDVFRNYKISHPTQSNRKCTIYEASSATAAAPVYFERVKLKSDSSEWVDGGFAQNRNNPIHEVVAEIEREKAFKDRKIGCLLSIGTGVPSVKNISNHVAPVMKHAVEMLTDSEEIANEFAKTSTCIALEASGRYFRFNVPQGMDSINLDDYRETSKMKALTDNYLRVVATGNTVFRCAESLRKPDQNIGIEDISPVSILPGRNVLHFVKRPAYINRLMAFFRDSGEDSKRFVLHGMGGIGKTQLALHFAHEMKQHCKVFWLGADSFSSFVKDYALVYANLIPGASKAASILKQEELLNSTTDALERNPQNWMLILDNADDLDVFMASSGNANGIDKYLPKVGRILLTTRDPRFAGTFSPVSNDLCIKVMEIDDAKSLLLNSVPQNLLQDTEDEHIEELLSQLGYLPLGIAQAAVNIRDLAISLEDYLKLSLEKSDQTKLLSTSFMDTQTTSDRNRIQSCLVTWELSFQFLEGQFPQAMAVLEFCSLLHWRGIPVFLVRALLEFKDVSDIAFAKLLARLSHSSLITRATTKGQEIDIHPMIHARVFARLTEAKAVACISSVLSLMAIIFPYQRYIEDIELEVVVDHTRSRLLLPHALLLIERLEEKRVVSEHTARLYRAVSSHLLNVGQNRVANIFSNKAYAQAQETFPPGDLFIFHTCKDLINCLMIVEHYDKALIHVHQAIQMLTTPQIASQLSIEERSEERRFMQIRYLVLLSQTSNAGFDSAVEQTVDEALKSRELSLLIPLQKVALELMIKKQYIIALKLSERCLKICDSFIETSTKNTDRWHYARSLEITAGISLACSRSSFDTAAISKTSRNALNLAMRAFNEYWNLTDATDSSLWTICYTIAEIAIDEAPSIGVDAFERLIDKALQLPKTDIKNEGVIAGIGGTIQTMFRYSTRMKILRKTTLRKQIEKLKTSCYKLLERLDATLMDAIAGPSAVIIVAACLLTTGNPAEALSLCRQVLKLHYEILELRARDELLYIHYIIVVCLSRLSDQASKIEEHRREHAEILREVDLDSFEQDCAIFEQSSELYKIAKQLRDTGKLKYKDEWWNEHASYLEEAELFYGLLFEED